MYSINELTELSCRYQLNETKGNYWTHIDNLPLDDIILWSERLTKTKLLSNVSGKDWLKLIDIIRLAKNDKIELTQKQKRFMVMCLLPHWDYLSSPYVI